MFELDFMSEILLKCVNEYSASTLIISSVFLREYFGSAHVCENIYGLCIQNFNLL